MWVSIPTYVYPPTFETFFLTLEGSCGITSMLEQKNVGLCRPCEEDNASFSFRWVLLIVIPRPIFSPIEESNFPVIFPARSKSADDTSTRSSTNNSPSNGAVLPRETSSKSIRVDSYRAPVGLVFRVRKRCKALRIKRYAHALRFARACSREHWQNVWK